MANNYIIYNKKLFSRIYASVSEYHFSILYSNCKNHQSNQKTCMHGFSYNLKHLDLPNNNQDLDKTISYDAKLLSRTIYSALINNLHASIEYINPINTLLHHKTNNDHMTNQDIYSYELINYSSCKNSSKFCVLNSPNDIDKYRKLTNKCKDCSFKSITQLFDESYNGYYSRECLELFDEESLKLYSHHYNDYIFQLSDSELNQLCILSFNKIDANSQKYKSTGSNEKPTEEQLSRIKNILMEQFPRLLRSRHRFDIYTDNVIFENNWFPGKNYKTKGIWNYGLELIKFRVMIYAQLSNAQMNLLKVSENREDGTIELRWRITGVHHIRNLMFWKYISVEDQEWLDGVSLFFVNNKGLVYKHVMHRMDKESNHVEANTGLLKKLVITLPLPATS